MDKNTLSQTTWECKYHIVFAPKFRRQVIYGAIKADVANILSTLCKRVILNTYTHLGAEDAKEELGKYAKMA